MTITLTAVEASADDAARIHSLLLRIYPHEFRDRFRDDLERDVADLLGARGRRAAWRAVLPDLVRSLPSTHPHVGPAAGAAACSIRPGSPP